MPVSNTLRGEPMSTLHDNRRPTAYWRSAGMLMVLAAIALLVANAARAFVDPFGFAAFFGLPLDNSAEAGFVVVYAIRALFVGALALTLALLHEVRALAWFSAIAVIMPIGDAILLEQTNPSAAVLARHVVTAIFLLLTAWQLNRLASATALRR
jgi:uncharacterized membrane protein